MTRNGLLSAVGNTPLIQLDMFEEKLNGALLYAKLETLNPGGSLKDRPVSRMITEAIKEGAFKNGRRLLDSSSGNAGIAYAQFGATLGVPVTLVIPGNASQERLERIRAHGAEIILTDPLEGYDFALKEARRLAQEKSDLYWYSDQYSNENNWRAHYETTGVEILDQFNEMTQTLPDIFVAGVGTGGTITGTGRRLKEANPQIKIVAIIPEIFPGIEGLKPLESPDDIVPEILDLSLIDEKINISLEEALSVCHQLGKHGFFVGPSSGAYVAACLKISSSYQGKTIVTILNDTGERYFSTKMWERSAS